MALVKLAETTGEQRYADLAEYFVRQRGRQPLYFELEDRRRAREDGRNYAPREQNYATTRPTSRSRNRRRPSDTPSAPPTSTPEPPTWHA